MKIETAIKRALAEGYTNRAGIILFAYAFLAGYNGKYPRMLSIKARYRRMHHEAFLMTYGKHVKNA